MRGRILQSGVLGLLLAVAFATCGSAQLIWTAEGADNRWDNPDNWADGFVPSAGDRVLINGPEAEGAAGPLIAEGMEAVTDTLISDFGTSNVTMTGGRLELAGWGSWWADAAGTTATFTMSGGLVEFTGSPGIMELGWQEDFDPEGSSVGIWEMTGGEVYAKGVDMPGKGHGGAGIINLYGGVLNVGVERGGLMLYEGAQIDITDGLLVLEGDQTSVVEDYIGNGWIVAFGGDGELELGYDGDFTTVAAMSNFLPGDFNRDGVVDAADIDMMTQDCILGESINCGAIDLDGNGVVNTDDHRVLIKEILNTYYGDANLDGEFNSGDLVAVLGSGTYETDTASLWASGDFNADGRTNSGDLVVALGDGGYELGPRASAPAVPEPGSLGLLIAGGAGLIVCRRR